MLYVGEVSSEGCLLLLPIAKNSVEVLKEKVLKLSAEFFAFFACAARVNDFETGAYELVVRKNSTGGFRRDVTLLHSERLVWPGLIFLFLNLVDSKGIHAG